jgi:hypothetical protein
VSIDSKLKPPRGLRADQVLTSYLFGLTTSSDDRTKYEIERLSDLLGKPQRSVREEKEINKLRSILNEKLGSAETELERRVSRAVENVLIEDAQQTVQETPRDATTPAHKESIKPEAVELEIKRQLNQVLKNL